ncbi:MAG: hypothetical protein AAF787_01625 [Chloroflexota bacterium]
MVEYTQRKLIDGRDYMYQLISVMLLAMAATLGIFSAAYIRDLETLRTVPDAIWDAICGRPDPDSLTLPLLLTFATMCLLGGVGVYIYRRVRLARIS